MEVEVYDSYSSICDSCWKRIVPGTHLPLSLDYLRAAEQTAPESITFRAAIIRENSRPVMVVACQYVHLQLRDALPNDGIENLRPTARIWGKVWRSLANGLSIRMLVCGSEYLSHQAGFYAVPEIDCARTFDYVSQAMVAIQLHEAPSQRATVCIIRDIKECLTPLAKTLVKHGYSLLPVDPDMLMPIRWQTFSDYVSNLTAAYRRNFRRMNDLGQTLQRRSLDANQIAALNSSLQRVYDLVQEKHVRYATQQITPHLAALRDSLGENFEVMGYFFDEQLVGFASWVVGDSRLSLYRIGMEHSYNRSHGLYLNMLYDCVKAGIAHGVGEISFGRTSYETKSSLGAMPVPTVFWIRHTNRLWNRLLGTICSRVRRGEWIERHPFSREHARNFNQNN